MIIAFPTLGQSENRTLDKSLPDRAYQVDLFLKSQMKKNDRSINLPFSLYSFDL